MPLEPNKNEYLSKYATLEKFARGQPVKVATARRSELRDLLVHQW